MYLEGTDDVQMPPSDFFYFKSYAPIYFDVCFPAEAFEMLGRESAGEVDVQGLQYPYLSMSICHFVARLFGLKWKSVRVLYFGESGKHKKVAFFTCVNITCSFSKVSAGLPGLCSSSPTMYLKVPP